MTCRDSIHAFLHEDSKPRILDSGHLVVVVVVVVRTQ
jgi:hypothetical protein